MRSEKRRFDDCAHARLEFFACAKVIEREVVNPLFAPCEHLRNQAFKRRHVAVNMRKHACHCTANISAGVLEQWMQSVQTELVDCGIQVDDSCMMCARRMLLLDTEVRDLQTSSKCRKRRSMPDHTFDATHVRANAMETKDDDRAAAADDDGAAE